MRFEYIMNPEPHSCRQRLCAQVGSIGTMVLMVHYSTHTIPKWDILVTVGAYLE